MLYVSKAHLPNSIEWLSKHKHLWSCLWKKLNITPTRLIFQRQSTFWIHIEIKLWYFLFPIKGHVTRRSLVAGKMNELLLMSISICKIHWRRRYDKRISMITDTYTTKLIKKSYTLFINKYIIRYVHILFIFNIILFCFIFRHNWRG